MLGAVGLPGALQRVQARPHLGLVVLAVLEDLAVQADGLVELRLALQEPGPLQRGAQGTGCLVALLLEHGFQAGHDGA